MSCSSKPSSSGLLFAAMIMASFICLAIVADQLHGSNVTGVENPVEIVRAYPAENSCYLIDLNNPDPSILPDWQ